MTATARVASTTAASTAYTASIAAGAVGNFAAIGVMSGTERIVFECSNGAASVWQPIAYTDGSGEARFAELNQRNNTVLIQGPVDFRINKSATAIAVEVTQYT